MTPIAIKKLIVNKNMKHYNFDEVIERHGTSCVKFDRLKEMFGDENLIPLWVADMDFRTPDFIVEALKKRCEHEIFGYTFGSDEYYESIINWVHYKHNWKIQREWISYIPGIVKGIAFAIQCFTQKGDKVIIQDKCKVLILCNPHNPGGIVWKKETLVRLAEICTKHNILVISDEIHAEMAYPQYTHYPFASVSDTAASCSVTFMAPSKTFNIAGIVTSYAIVPNDRIREEFYSFLEAGEFGDGTIFAYTATTAAYTYGAEWLQQMRMYIMENVRFVEEFMKLHLPKIKVYQPQASFLVWLDCRELELSQDELVHLFKDKAGLALNDGSIFGPGGEGHMRLNIGCPRSVLDKAMNALKKAVDKK